MYRTIVGIMMLFFGVGGGTADAATINFLTDDLMMEVDLYCPDPGYEWLTFNEAYIGPGLDEEHRIEGLLTYTEYEPSYNEYINYSETIFSSSMYYTNNLWNLTNTNVLKIRHKIWNYLTGGSSEIRWNSVFSVTGDDAWLFLNFDNEGGPPIASLYDLTIGEYVFYADSASELFEIGDNGIHLEEHNYLISSTLIEYETLYDDGSIGLDYFFGNADEVNYAVPEPSTAILSLASLFILARIKQRKKKYEA